MADEELLSEERGENLALHEAIEAIRKGDRVRARDILTRLLKADQGNAMCWIWLSTAVDTSKERIYCLQTALQLDPQNYAAKRGLIMLGGLPPDDTVQPFSLNRPRTWEEQLSIPQEPKEKKRGSARPIGRLLIIAVGSLAVLAVAYFGFLAPNAFALPFINRPRLQNITVTFTPTGTLNGPTPTLPKPTPLAMLMKVTYTPTPLYVMTQHPVDSQGSFNAGLHFFEAQDYENAVAMFKQVLEAEPEAVDAYYYVGESYRMLAAVSEANNDQEQANKDYQNARFAYQTAINLNPNFAPSYLGRALITIVTNPEQDSTADFNSAIALDPYFTAAYIQRGEYLRTRHALDAALKDERAALQLDPNSALAYMYLARVQLDRNENEEALVSAMTANQIDLTLVSAYLVLAQAYIANGQTENATAALQTYTTYNPKDIDAYLTMGYVYNSIGQYQSALDILNQYINANPRDADGYYERGMAYLSMQNNTLAEIDFKKAVDINSNHFNANLGLARAYYAEGHANNAYIQVMQGCTPLIENDHQKAEVYYWEAVFLEGMKNTDAAKQAWRNLLLISEDMMPSEWRDEAFLHLGIKPTSTVTLR